MAFLTKADLKTKAPIEIVDAVTQLDDTIITEIIDENIDEMKAHMAHYDIDTIFSDAGKVLPGIKVVLKHLKGMVINEIFRKRNSNYGEKAADDAIIFLEKVNNKKLTLNLPLAPEPTEEDTTYEAYMDSKDYYETDF